MRNAFFHRLWVVAALGILGVASLSTGADDVVIICNQKIFDPVLTRDDVKDIFLGKKTKWSNGTKIEFATHRNSDVHELFLRAFIGRTSAQFGNHWKKEVFTGKGRMPRTAEDDQQMIRFVAETDGAIGYISSTARTDSVTIPTIQ